jgi:Cap4-like dsDNA endonuclease family protein
MSSRSQGEEHQAWLALMVLETLGVGDPTGAITLARYRYQTKITVSAWLTCLLPDGPVAVACERVEDQVVIHQMRLRFQQVKTRDKGVWTPAKVCEDGGGLDALVRAYRIAREAGHLEIASFELLLEGPSTDRRDGAAFFADPTTASANVRRRLRDHGLPAECRRLPLPSPAARRPTEPGHDRRGQHPRARLPVPRSVLPHDPYDLRHVAGSRRRRAGRVT